MPYRFGRSGSVKGPHPGFTPAHERFTPASGVPVWRRCRNLSVLGADAGWIASPRLPCYVYANYFMSDCGGAATSREFRYGSESSS